MFTAHKIILKNGIKFNVSGLSEGVDNMPIFQ